MFKIVFTSFFCLTMFIITERLIDLAIRKWCKRQANEEVEEVEKVIQPIGFR